MAEVFPPGASFSIRGIYLAQAYARFCFALEKRPQRNIVSSDPKVEREILHAVENVCREHSQNLKTDPTLPFPHEVSLFLADLLSEALAGGEPESFRILRRTGQHSGAPKMAARDKGDVLAAVVYVKACKQGIIRDAAPNKTIRKHYDVSEQTVRRWCANDNYKDIDPNLIQVPDNYESLLSFIPDFMKSAGKDFKQSRRNRSHAATNRRNSKR